MKIKDISVKLATVLSIILLTGCSAWQARYGNDKPHISFVIPEGTAPDRIYVWNPNTTAAYIYPQGQACISSAEVFKTRDFDFSAATTIGAISSIENLSADAKAKLVENVTKLAEKDAAGTFLSVALFNICQIAANNRLSAQEAKQLTEHAITKAAEVANNADDK